MKVEIITVGDELLWGQKVDTNAAFLGHKLTQMGLPPQWQSTVGDDPEAIREVLSLALGRADLILMSGGLGATADDITRSAVAGALGRRLILDEHVLETIRQRLTAGDRAMLGGHQSMALLPQGSRILNNPLGLAPGLYLDVNGRYIFIFPGVPQEMGAIFEQQALPILEKLPREKIVRRRRLRTVSIGETAISEKLRGIRLKEVRLSFLPEPWSVDLWLTARSSAAGEAEALLSRTARQIEDRLENDVYGVDDDTLERVVAALLIMKSATISVAESCTGGLLANRLTDVAGSSAYFERGVVAYSDRAKEEILAVPKETLRQFGAVSPQTATAMAEGIRRKSGTTLGLSTTGIAGPTGATVDKPVGLVFAGLAHPEGSVAQRFLFGQDRLINKECAVRAALDLVRRYLLSR
jgi:nicotinamide-nucleotide amidase